MKKKEISKLSEQDVAEEIIEEANEEVEREKAKVEKVGSHDTRNVIVFILALLLVIGMAVFLYYQFFVPKSGYDETYAYNGFVFERSGALWKTEVYIGGNIVTVPMHYGPKQLNDVSISGLLNRSFGSGPIYISFDPTIESDKGSIALAAGELSLNIVQGIGKTDLIAACSKNETEECFTRPIVDCSQKDKSVIFFAESDESFVTMNDTCVMIYGRGEGIVKATDRLLLFWYGIMGRDAN